MPFETLTEAATDAAPKGGAPRHDGNADAGRSAPERDQASMPVWCQPLSLTQLALLIVLTLGFYVLFWTGHLISDVRRHLDPKVRVWRYVLGLLFPLTAPFVFYRMTGHVAAFLRRDGLALDPPRAAITTLFLVGYGANFLLGWASADLSPMLFLLLLAVTLFYSLPWLLLQRQMNTVKASLKSARWTAEPFTFTGAQISAIAIFGVIWVLGALSPILEERLETIQQAFVDGDPVKAGEPIGGPSGFYNLRPDGVLWQRVPVADSNPDADLVLVGPGSDTWVTVFADRGGNLRFDDIVDGRRANIAEQLENLTIEERRELLPESNLPASFARYQGRAAFSSHTTTFWVATFVIGSDSVEVVGHTVDSVELQESVERTIKSLRSGGSPGES